MKITTAADAINAIYHSPDGLARGLVRVLSTLSDKPAVARELLKEREIQAILHTKRFRDILRSGLLTDAHRSSTSLFKS